MWVLYAATALVYGFGAIALLMGLAPSIDGELRFGFALSGAILVWSGEQLTDLLLEIEKESDVDDME